MVRLLSVAKRKVRVALLMERFQNHLGRPEMILFYKTPFQFLVSNVLSAKVSDVQVNKVMNKHYEQGLAPETIVQWGESRLLKEIRTIGLAPTKARRLLQLSHILIEKFSGDVPSTREELEALPGVGRKTANVILGTLFGQAVMAVDTHVFRVTRRLGLHDEATAEKAEQELLKVIDGEFLHGQHRYFIMHGKTICKALRPLCDSCYVSDLCPSYRLLRG